jgi:hypothetical protein
MADIPNVYLFAAVLRIRISSVRSVDRDAADIDFKSVL